MTWIVEPLERKDAAGRPSGLWRLCADSDAGGGFVPGCAHDHASAREAQECEEALDKMAEVTGFPRRRKGDPIELWRLDRHPLAVRFYGLARELDKLPGGERQTALMSKLDELRRETQALLDDPDYRAQIS